MVADGEDAIFEELCYFRVERLLLLKPDFYGLASPALKGLRTVDCGLVLALVVLLIGRDLCDNFGPEVL